MKNLIKRNLLIFFRDKAAVFFSLLGVFVIIGLYVLFLGDMLVKGMNDTPGARFLMDSWIMSGLLAVTPITTVLGSLGIMIEDKQRKIYKDFLASPVKRSVLAGGYIINSFIVSLILTFITLILAEIYVLMNGGELLSLEAFLKVVGLTILTVLYSSFMMFFMVSFFKSNNAFATASTVIGTLIGFLTGVYIPIGELPGSVQTVVKIFPPSHSAVLLRKIMMEEAEKISFAGAPVEALEEFRLSMGISFELGDKVLSSYASILYILIITVLFCALSIKQITYKPK
ncbi:multidrug/hemolysin transport system permease protein [Mobilisporobacter senegalensis]|uniref:Transport permease protein n=1 Tax=Mobilisporobacter senegalensis TaxID=1329262 RepID=A0A3N1XZ36_9FIRM|nr:ABC transporter permease [Mobilisporobacter senegalensis]ROR31839.1 multidrug/hemolysin transport system permease protein [Mobilisporobacter senegalensis]